MIQVGIFTGYFPYGLEETARRIRDLGFTNVQLDLAFKDMDLTTEAINDHKCLKIRNMFRSYNLPVCCISGYTNLVHPVADVRKTNLEHLKTIIRHARQLGSEYVISETGTFNPDSDWASHPDNKTEHGYQECLEVIGDIVELARKCGVKFLIETYVNNVIGSIDETLRVFADIDSSHFGLLMDPTNYFETHNIGDMDNMLDKVFNALSHKIKIAHAKDVKLAGADMGIQMSDIDADESHSLRGVGQIELPAPGMGSLNYDLYLKRLAKDHSNIPLIIEHLELDDIKRAKSFIDNKLMAGGF